MAAPLTAIATAPLLAPGEGWGSLLPWLVLIGLVGIGWLVVLLARTLRGVEETREVAREALAIHAELRETVSKFASERSDIDLRRLEHVLIDQRDALNRLEDALLSTVNQAVSQRAAEARAAVPRGEPVPKERADELGERIVNRLIAMGYERVHLAAERQELEDLDEDRDEVPVEAHKLGVVYKGRVVLTGGRIVDVDLDPPYAVFP